MKEQEEKLELAKSYKELNRKNVNSSYRRIVYAIAYIVVQFCFMFFLPLHYISTIHTNLLMFIEGVPSVCYDEGLPCIALANVQAWSTVNLWTIQSIIKPLWGGDYGENVTNPTGNKKGIIMEYLSVGDEILIGTRGTQSTENCPNTVEEIVINCKRRKVEPFLSEMSFNGAPLSLDPAFNNMLPHESLHAPQSLRNVFTQTISLRNSTLTEALAQWGNLYQNGFVSASTEQLYIAFIVVAPDAPQPHEGGMISLVQIHFFTDPIAGGIKPGYTVFSFPASVGFQAAESITWTIIYCLLLFYSLVIEITKILGFRVEYGLPRPMRREDGITSTSSALCRYIKRFHIWSFVKWVLLFLGTWSIILKIEVQNQIDEASADLRKLDSMSSGIAHIISAQSKYEYFELIASLSIFCSGFRLFEFFGEHPRLGETTRTVSAACSAISHFLLVMIVFLVLFMFAGHFLFGLGNPTNFGTLYVSFISIFKMLRGQGEISYQDLLQGHGADTIPMIEPATLSVLLFYVGFYFVMSMLLLNILIAIIMQAYVPVHKEVMDLPNLQYNIFHDILQIPVGSFRYFTGGGEIPETLNDSADAASRTIDDLQSEHKNDTSIEVLEKNVLIGGNGGLGIRTPENIDAKLIKILETGVKIKMAQNEVAQQMSKIMHAWTTQEMKSESDGEMNIDAAFLEIQVAQDKIINAQHDVTRILCAISSNCNIFS